MSCSGDGDVLRRHEREGIADIRPTDVTGKVAHKLFPHLSTWLLAKLTAMSAVPRVHQNKLRNLNQICTPETNIYKYLGLGEVTGSHSLRRLVL